MDSAALTVLRDRLAAALTAVDEAIAAAGRRCHDCHRHGAGLTQCDDGNWRGPKCREVYEAGAGQQLPIEKGN